MDMVVARVSPTTQTELDVPVQFAVEIPANAAFGSRLRKKELQQIIGRMLKREKPVAIHVDETHMRAVFAEALSDSVRHRLARDIAARVREFRKEALHPRVVDELLGISARERRRWIKDGRLPISGSGSFRRGRQVIRFPLHPPGKIAALAASPHVIAEWRQRDEGDGAANDPRS